MYWVITARGLERGETVPEELTAPRPSAVSVVPGEPEAAVSNLRRSRTSMAMIAERYYSARSTWRFPSNRGEVPRYMQRAFRWKTFGLMTLQLCAVLLIAVPLREAELLDLITYPEEMGNLLRQGIVYSFGVLNLLCILLLHCYKDHFPANYLLLVITTLSSGVFWSMAYNKNFMTMMQFEILAILCITMFCATVISRILSGLERKLHGSVVLLLSFFPGWCTGCCAILLQRFLLTPPVPLELAGACSLSAILIGILFLDVGPLLVRCDPDDFMRVIVSMNSTMMVVVSIPFFFLAFCMLRLDHREDDLAPVPELPGSAAMQPVPQPELQPRVSAVTGAERLGVAY
eukprot:s2290_g6.t2